MIGIIDNYDSFTYNLVQAIGSLVPASEIRVWRNDGVTLSELEILPLSHLIISPGPGRPESAGKSLDAIRSCAGRIPILGVCLGFQCIGVAYGAKMVAARSLMHGKVSMVRHDGDSIFAALPNPMPVARYHSLALNKASLPSELVATAWADDGELMGIRHRILNIYGVQFHPESFLTPHGPAMLDAFFHSTIPSHRSQTTFQSDIPEPIVSEVALR